MDLASQPVRTGLVVLRWDGPNAEVERAVFGATDAEILEVAKTGAVGIDAPFGWPAAFRQLLAGEAPTPWNNDVRDRLSFRKTDFAVREVMGRWPLSVSTDRIALPALRAQGLLAALSVTDRSRGRVVEAYPALALRRWGLPFRGYKKPTDRAVRETIWAGLQTKAPWLRMTDPATLLAHADVLDALIAALIAEVAVRGLAAPIPDDPALRQEGWIVIPDEDALARLATSEPGSDTSR
ncbi:MAG: DUF429 domain-containing protein [Myxococcota bacterium]